VLGFRYICIYLNNIDRDLLFSVHNKSEAHSRYCSYSPSLLLLLLLLLPTILLVLLR